MPKQGGWTIDRIAKFVAHRRQGGAPDEVIEAAKRSLLNILGASAGAVSMKPIRLLRVWASETRGTGSAKVLWTGECLPPDAAALVNAAAMHVLDFDDTHIPSHAHVSATAASTALALACEHGASGSELLSAYIVGAEAHLAFSTAIMPEHFRQGFHVTATGGTVASAVVSACLMKLAPAATRRAIAAAMLVAGGLREGLVSASNAFGVGNAARAGIVAAQLAARGFGSVGTAFDGRDGFRRAMSGVDSSRTRRAFDGLGTKWLLLENSHKRFPTETISQASVQAVLALRKRMHDLAPDSIERIELHVAPLVAEVVADRSARITPHDVLTRTFDTKFCVSRAWLSGSFFASTLEVDGDEEVGSLALRDRVSVYADSNLGVESAVAVVVLPDGSEFTESVAAYKGSQTNPMSVVELQDKLQLAGPMNDERSAAIVDAIWQLQDHGSLVELMRLVESTPDV